IEDLLSPDTCVCRTDDRCLVEGLQDVSLEIVMPRGDSDHIVMVLGEQAGKVGQILQREPEREWALVQLGQDPQVLQLPYDSICHYLGRDKDN
ncbi:GPKOW protein, partial [Malurus elegans]|nr:GPKOW protein [Malurus elegans]